MNWSLQSRGSNHNSAYLRDYFEQGGKEPRNLSSFDTSSDSLPNRAITVKRALDDLLELLTKFRQLDGWVTR
jgi:hypothetical protein